MNPSPDNFNPYQTPDSVVTGDEVRRDRCWRSGRKVYVPTGGDLPACCVRCGVDAEPARKPKNCIGIIR